MNLGADRRGRVPFALVGVVLLVASAGLSATLRTAPAPPGDGAVEAAVERVTAETWTAVRRATRRAGRRAARSPVVHPADGPYGAVLNDSTPFRDYLRIRVYVAVADALEGVRARAGGVQARAALPPTADPAALRAAKRRVSVAPAANGSALRVRIAGIQVRAVRGGRVVERTDLTVALVAATPVLGLHDLVAEYERRLDRGPLAGPGLGRRLTARLYPVAWTRGYAQYGGAPIANVVANRHVEVAANGGILGVQAAVFGGTDPAGRRALRRASRAVAATDLLVGSVRTGAEWTDTVLTGTNPGRPEYPLVPDRPPLSGPGPDHPLTVGVNRSADRAFHGFVAGAGSRSLQAVLRSVYSAEVRLAASVRHGRREARPPPDPPGGNWTLVDERTAESVRVDPAAAPTPAVPRGWHVLERYSRRVVVRHSAVRRWRRGTATRTTRANWTRIQEVGVAVLGRHAPSDHAPDRPIAGVHDPGGALDGPNLDGVGRLAVDRLVAARGGADALARRAVAGTLDRRPVTVRGRRPDGLREWVYRDLAALRERVRNVTVSVPRGTVASDAGRAPRHLVAALRSREPDLVDAPREYDGVAGKARVAARAAYLRRVVAELERRADRAGGLGSGLGEALSAAGSPAGGRIDEVVAARNTVTRQERHAVLRGGPAGPVPLAVDAAPAYLPTSRVTADRVPAVPGDAYYPLAARNVNLFTVPYGDAARGVADALLGPRDRVSLRTAGRALFAANRTLARRPNGTLARRRTELRRTLDRSLGRLRDRLDVALAAETRLDGRGHRAAVRAGFARWDSTARRALAAANGSAAAAVAAAAARRAGLPPGPDRDWLGLRLRIVAAAAVRSNAVRPPLSVVNRSVAATRAVRHLALEAAAGEVLGAATEALRRRWGGPRGSWAPAGLPVTPVPGYWYATVNVWQITVRGTYARFAVRAPGTGARPGRPGVAYVRDGDRVAVDVTGDGDPERLGRAGRIAFETRTTVVVVVPPNGGGVGDVTGDRDEQSPGWPGDKS